MSVPAFRTHEATARLFQKPHRAHFSAPDTPAVIKLMDTPLRDTSICLGHDNTYYMTGTIQPFWKYNEGIKLWKSPDLAHWQPLGMVWKYGSSPWHRPYLEAGKPL